MLKSASGYAVHPCTYDVQNRLLDLLSRASDKLPKLGLVGRQSRIALVQLLSIAEWLLAQKWPACFVVHKVHAQILEQSAIDPVLEQPLAQRKLLTPVTYQAVVCEAYGTVAAINEQACLPQATHNWLRVHRDYVDRD